MVAKSKVRKSRGSSKRFIGKPRGRIQDRVQAVGPEHFGIVAVDCAKRRSKWMLCNFYGKIVIEPTIVEHTAGGLRAMAELITQACRDEGLTDTLVAVEMTGIYHKPVCRAFRKARFDTRIVHPYVSKHYRESLHPDVKTDDNDLEAIFHAAINGYGLVKPPVSDVYQSLQAISRYRHNLVKQRSRLMVQIRRLLHQTMPGFADLFDEDRLFHKSIALPVALKFDSADAICRVGVDGIVKHLHEVKVQYFTRTVERVVAWARNAAEPSDLAMLHTRQWQQLNELRSLITEHIAAAEREIAGFLAKTPYILLLSVTGINVVSAARLAGEAGPIEHYPTARAINGRAGLFPSRYQSDHIDYANGSLVRQCNRKLRGAATMVAENLRKCHSYYRGLSELWKRHKVDPRDCRSRIANRAMRMVFQLVGGRQLWRGKGVDCEYVLAKLQKFHRDHNTPIEQTIRDMNEAIAWLPKHAYAAEAKPIAELACKQQRGPTPIGDLLVPLLLRLGVTLEESVESNMSEARSSD